VGLAETFAEVPSPGEDAQRLTPCDWKYEELQSCYREYDFAIYELILSSEAVGRETFLREV